MVRGLGLGVAPIGHTVTVEGATAETVDVHAQITFVAGYDWNTLKSLVETVIEDCKLTCRSRNGG
jgi:hypothetical protein